MKTTLRLDEQIDVLTKDELSDALGVQTQNIFRAYARGVKYMRFGPVSTTIANSAFSLDGTGHPQLGPREGFIWSIRRLLITGLNSGGTPDIVNIFRSQTAGIPVWQLNGNSFGVTFGKCEFLLLPGEALSIANSGTIAATGQVTVSGDLIEVAAEEIIKLL